MKRIIQIEGYTQEDIVEFSDEQMDSFVFCGEPIVLKAGNAVNYFS